MTGTWDWLDTLAVLVGISLGYWFSIRKGEE